jgi:hypothetical protein
MPPQSTQSSEALLTPITMSIPVLLSLASRFWLWGLRRGLQWSECYAGASASTQRYIDRSYDVGDVRIGGCVGLCEISAAEIYAQCNPSIYYSIYQPRFRPINAVFQCSRAKSLPFHYSERIIFNLRISLRDTGILFRTDDTLVSVIIRGILLILFRASTAS